MLKEAAVGANLRPAGQDVRKGQMVLERGTLLRPSEIGVLASLGRDTVEVVRRPVVAVLATGDELLEPGEPAEAGKIYNSNSYGVAAEVLRYGGIPRILGIARDNLESMNEKLEEGLTADVLLTSAGVSRGDYDIVKDVLASRGQIDFWSVRMRPAKPLAFGVFDVQGGRRVPHVGLPGNPVSALVAFEELVRPALLKMQGRTDLEKATDTRRARGRHCEQRRKARVRQGRHHAEERPVLRAAHGRPGFRRAHVDGAGQRARDMPGGRAGHARWPGSRRADAGLARGRRAGVADTRHRRSREVTYCHPEVMEL